MLSYLQGCDLLHKVSLLSRQTRADLLKANCSGQSVVITVKEFKAGVVTIPPLNSFEYALCFADVIHLRVDAETFTVASAFISMIMMRNKQQPNKITQIELTCKLFVQENYTSTDFFNDIVL